MMKRILLALALLIGLSAPAYAVELNSDTGCDSSGTWMLGTGWTVTGSKCVGTSVNRMQMLMQMTSKVKQGHRYRLAFTVSSYSAGQVRAFVGVTMPTAVAGSYITAASVSDVADNFTTASGLTTVVAKSSFTGPGDSAEQGGAMRFGCNSAGFGYNDQIVFPGIGSPHLHEFYGNSGAATPGAKSWTFTDFRTKGSSSCANRTDPAHPIVRTGYWIPAMFDGLGNVKRAASLGVYYKGPSNPALNYTGHISTEGDPALKCGLESDTADCRNIPTGLRMTFGYKSSDGTNGPSHIGIRFRDAIGLSCWGGPNNEGGTTGQEYTLTYKTLAEIMAVDQCVVGSWLHVGIDFPYCWDGVNVDSPDHRSHINYGNNIGKCVAPNSVRLPGISIQAFYLIDAAFIAHRWRVASDEMAAGCYNGTTTVAVTAGCTYHGDYFEAWSPTVRDKWFNKCIWAHNSCSTELGDGTSLKGGGINYDGTGIDQNGGQKVRPDDVVPLTKYGMSKDVVANGTYSFDITAAGDGVWGLMGLGGFTGSLDSISFQEIGSGAKGPVTVHN